MLVAADVLLAEDEIDLDAVEKAAREHEHHVPSHATPLDCSLFVIESQVRQYVIDHVGMLAEVRNTGAWPEVIFVLTPLRASRRGRRNEPVPILGRRRAFRNHVWWPRLLRDPAAILRKPIGRDYHAEAVQERLEMRDLRDLRGPAVVP